MVRLFVFIKIAIHYHVFITINMAFTIAYQCKYNTFRTFTLGINFQKIGVIFINKCFRSDSQSLMSTFSGI